MTGYERVKLVWPRDSKDEDQSDRADEQGLTSLWMMPEFLGATDGMVEGYYSTEGNSESTYASYSYYNRWREQLAILVGTTAKTVWAKPRPGPFVELINNADNEGTIGPKTAAKLASDFEAWADRAIERDVALDGFSEFYGELRKVFSVVGPEGTVKLH